MSNLPTVRQLVSALRPKLNQEQEKSFDLIVEDFLQKKFDQVELHTKLAELITAKVMNEALAEAKEHVAAEEVSKHIPMASIIEVTKTFVDVPTYLRATTFLKSAKYDSSQPKVYFRELSVIIGKERWDMIITKCKEDMTAKQDRENTISNLSTIRKEMEELKKNLATVKEDAKKEVAAVKEDAKKEVAAVKKEVEDMSKKFLELQKEVESLKTNLKRSREEEEPVPTGIAAVAAAAAEFTAKRQKTEPYTD